MKTIGDVQSVQAVRFIQPVPHINRGLLARRSLGGVFWPVEDFDPLSFAAHTSRDPRSPQLASIFDHRVGDTWSERTEVPVVSGRIGLVEGPSSTE